MIKKDIHKRGFTLVELLTVMSIIAVLASISIFALAGARGAARDARRKADLESVASALELYKADCNSYPSTLPAVGSPFTGTACGLAANRYMEAIPDDPLTGQNYYYEPLNCVGVNCTRFRYWTTLEDNPGAGVSGCSGSPNCGGPLCNYCVHNP